MNRHPTHRPDDLAIGRMQRILEEGRWPSGLELSPDERELVTFNLRIARRDRVEARFREATGYRTLEDARRAHARA